MCLTQSNFLAQITAMKSCWHQRPLLNCIALLLRCSAEVQVAKVGPFRMSGESEVTGCARALLEEFAPQSGTCLSGEHIPKAFKGKWHVFNKTLCCSTVMVEKDLVHYCQPLNSNYKMERR